MANRKQVIYFIPPNQYGFGSFLNNMESGKGLGKFGSEYSGLSQGMQGALGALGNMVGQVGGKAISGGMESGAGNVISGLSSVASAIPGPWGAVASAGLGVVGGLVNRAFGSKLNKENINEVNNNINQMKSFTSNAGSFDALQETMASQPSAMGFDKSFIGKDGWFSSKAKKKYRELKRKQEAAQIWVENSLDNNLDNLKDTQYQNMLANYSAYGGPLGYGLPYIGGAIDYDITNKRLQQKDQEIINQGKSVIPIYALGGDLNLFGDGGGIYIKPSKRGTFTTAAKKHGKSVQEFASQVLANKDNYSTAMVKKANFARNAAKWHSLGGPLQTHGGNWSTGLVLIDNGGTHEQNPFQGVPMGVSQDGTPNLVEEGEVIWNDYVFSNRLKVPSELREQYKLGKEDITFAQAIRAIQEADEERPNDPISKRTTNDALARFQQAQEQIRQEKAGQQGVMFALGGNLFPWGGKFDEDGMPINDDGSVAYVIAPQEPSPNNNPFENVWGQNLDVPKGTTPTRSTNPNPVTTQGNTKGSWLANLRYLPVLGAGVNVFTDAMGWTNKPDYSNADMITASASGIPNIKATPVGQYLRYTPLDRLFYINQLNSQAGATRRALLNTSGGNRGAAMAGLLAADFNAQNQLGQLARQAEEYNLGMRERVASFNRATDMFNSEADLKAQQANVDIGKIKVSAAQAAANMRDIIDSRVAAAKSANLTNLFNSLGDIGREEFQRNMVNSNRAMYYTIGSDGTISYKPAFYNLDTQSQLSMQKQAEDDAARRQGKAFGGYLTINRKKRR